MADLPPVYSPDAICTLMGAGPFREPSGSPKEWVRALFLPSFDPEVLVTVARADAWWIEVACAGVSLWYTAGPWEIEAAGRGPTASTAELRPLGSTLRDHLTLSTPRAAVAARFLTDASLDVEFRPMVLDGMECRIAWSLKGATGEKTVANSVIARHRGILGVLELLDAVFAHTRTYPHIDSLLSYVDDSTAQRLRRLLDPRRAWRRVRIPVASRREAR